MFIEIARTVRFTLWGVELQTLHPGEIFEVPPSVGRVLISEGYALETVTHTRLVWDRDAAKRDAVAVRSSTS